MLFRPFRKDDRGGDGGIERFGALVHRDAQKDVTVFAGFGAEAFAFGADDETRSSVKFFPVDFILPFSREPINPESPLFQISAPGDQAESALAIYHVLRRFLSLTANPFQAQEEN